MSARADWLASRKFGSSDCGRLLSGEYGGAWAVYVDHTTGVTTEEDDGLADRKALEPYILDRARVRLGWDVVAHGDVSLTHPTETWASCTPDAFRIVDGKRRLVEMKTTDVMLSGKYGRDGSEASDENLPDYVRFQVAFQQWIVQTLGLVDHGEPAYVLCFDGHFRLKHIVVPHDPALEAFVVMWCWEFVRDHIQKNVPPPVDGSEGCSAAVSMRYPVAVREEPVDLPHEAADLIEAYLDAKAEEAAAETRKKAAQQALQLMLGDAKAGRLGTTRISWSNVAGRTTFDAKSFEQDHPELARRYLRVGAGYRMFKVTEGKK